MPETKECCRCGSFTKNGVTESFFLDSGETLHNTYCVFCLERQVDHVKKHDALHNATTGFLWALLVLVIFALSYSK